MSKGKKNKKSVRSAAKSIVGRTKKPSWKVSRKVEEMYLSASQLSRAGNFNEAQQAYLAILALDPCHYPTLLQLANMAMYAGNPVAALNYAKKAAETTPDESDGHLVLGMIATELGLAELAQKELRRARVIEPNDTRILDSLATVLLQQGDSTAALEALQQSIKINPQSVAPYYLLSISKRFSSDDPDLDLMKNLEVKARPQDRTEMAKMHFAIAKMHHDCGEYDAAFASYQQGNQIICDEQFGQKQDYAELAQHIIGSVTPERVKKLQGGGDQSESPIFVLGMPRSGTTLIESLLCRHPDIGSIGEVAYISNLVGWSEQSIGGGLPYPKSLSLFTPELAEKIGSEYARLSRQYGLNSRYFVDKTPGNFLHIAFILAILPNAKLVHCRRDPVDTCLSIYQQYFPKSVEYSCDLKDIGLYYLFYRRLMSHWEELFPGRIHHVDYHKVVSDTETQLRQMLDYIGLDWNDACLEQVGLGYKSRTASMWQVRQPVYQSSVQRWRKYEKHLGPLLEVLKPILVDG